MTSREKFIEEIENITKHFENPCELKDVLSDEAFDFFESLKKKKPSSGLTENGQKILDYMNLNHEKFNNQFTSKSIAIGLNMAARSVSGSMNKLITDGYVNKLSTNPVSYELVLGKEG